MKSLCKQQQQSFDYFYNNIDIDALESMVDALSDCKGIRYFCGVGKSAYIAQKIAKHCASFGIPTQFICPTHAVHGDLGMIGQDDMIIALSHSGESSELIHLFSFLQKRQTTLALWTSKPTSTLSKKAHHCLHIPLDQELCAFNLSPTTSSILQLMVGDLVVVHLVSKLSVSKADYLNNHPMGGIGKAQLWTVSDIMHEREALPVCSPKTSMDRVILLLNEKRLGCVLIEENEKLIGIFTDGDLKRCLKNQSLFSETVAQHMTTNMRTTTGETKLIEALTLMESEPKVAVLPVMEKNKLIGLATFHSVVQPTIS